MEKQNNKIKQKVAFNSKKWRNNCKLYNKAEIELKVRNCLITHSFIHSKK
jgi:hypothetical protein